MAQSFQVFIVEDDLNHTRRLQRIALKAGLTRIETFVDAALALEELKKDRGERQHYS